MFFGWEGFKSIVLVESYLYPYSFILYFSNLEPLRAKRLRLIKLIQVSILFIIIKPINHTVNHVYGQ